MPEMLLFAGDPASVVPALAPADLAGRMKLFDLVDWHPDGWAWGEQELKSPVFRIVVWAGALQSQCEQLLGPTLDSLDPITHMPTTYMQPRAMFLNLLDPRIVAQMPDALAWWQDATRATPIYTVPSTLMLGIADVIIARAPIAVAP